MTFLPKRKLAGVAVALLAAAGLSASLAAAAAPADARAAKPLAKTGGFTAATVTGKPGSGVGVAYRIDGTPAAGTPVTLTLRFTGIDASTGAKVSIASSDGLLIAGERELTLTGAQQLQLSVLAAADGVYYVNVFSAQAGRSQVTSVPVTVGKGQIKLEKNGSPAQTPAGERVISLPSR